MATVAAVASFTTRLTLTTTQGISGYFPNVSSQSSIQVSASSSSSSSPIIDEKKGAGFDDLLIVGPGVLGRLVAQKWRQEHEGCEIYGQTVTVDHHEELIKAGITPCLKGTELDHKFPDDTPVVPIGRSPKTDILLHAEKLVLEFGGVVLRLAGLYKGDRGAHVYWLSKGTVDTNPDHVLNLIHYETRRASSRREVLHTNFLTPLVIKEAMLALTKLADLRAVSQGGFPQAEWCRISIGHPDVLTSDPDIIAALSITGNFGFQPCSHGDFLGAILGTGIVREKVGDIILQGEKGAQVIIFPELVDFLMTSLDKERSRKAHDHAAERMKSLEQDLTNIRCEIISLRSKRDKFASEANIARENLENFMQEYQLQVVKDAIASGVDGYDSDVKSVVRKATHGFRLSREAA